MLAASAITVTTLVSSFVVNRIKNYQAQKSQANAKQSLHQAQNIDTNVGHSSEYIIAQSLTPEGKRSNIHYKRKSKMPLICMRLAKKIEILVLKIEARKDVNSRKALKLKQLRIAFWRKAKQFIKMELKHLKFPKMRTVKALEMESRLAKE